MTTGTILECHWRKLEGLKQERQHWESHWQELNDSIVPGRLRITDTSIKGKKLTDKIVDNSPLLSWRVARSGMHSGLTSPTRPWARFGTFDQNLKENAEVKSYLSEATNKFRDILSVSNVYNWLHNGFGDQLLFGQFAGLVIPDEQNFIRAIPCLHGQFWLAQDYKGIVNTLYRRVWKTVEQVVAEFVAKPNGDMDWSNATTTLKNLWDTGSYLALVEIYHAVEPRQKREHGKIEARHKAYTSNYWEAWNSDPNKMLRESGFDKSPIIAPRWDVIADDAYGISPGMDALPDVKMLQVEQKRKGEAIDKMVRPPMTAPIALRNQRTSILPGSITYVDSANINSGYRPAFEVNPRTGELAADIQETQRRIDRTFYADLFLAISQMEGVQPRNVYELTARKEEQLLQLGPVIERQHHELIQRLVDIGYDIMVDEELLPKLPDALKDQELKVENISVLAQAQQAVSTGAIERFTSFVGNLAGIRPDVLDKADFDQSIDEYGDALGISPAIVVPDDKVKEVRDQRMQAQKQQQAVENTAQLAPAVQKGAAAARLLSETDANSNPLQLLSNLGIAG